MVVNAEEEKKKVKQRQCALKCSEGEGVWDFI